MERSFEKPEIIRNLESDLNNGKTNALDMFWKQIESIGTPIIEKFPREECFDLVTLIYKGNEKTKNVVLIPPVGMRRLEECVMDKISESDVWYISYKVRNDISFTYQFSHNDPLDNDWKRRWKNVEADRFNNKSIKYIDKSIGRERMVSYAELENAAKKHYIRNIEDSREGCFYEHEIFSSILNEKRNFKVYTPYGYDHKKEPYGVVVLNDGLEFEEILNVQNVLDNLIYEKKIPKVVTVLIKSTDSRGENLKCSDKFLEFIVSELMPMVKSKYNISENPEKNVIGGYSLGGLFASYAGLKHSDIFGNVLSQSGSYWYKKDDYKNTDELWISSEFKKAGKLPLKFYINVGVIEPKVSMKNTNENFKDTLMELGYKVKFEEFGSGHDYLYWGENLAHGLIYLIGLE